MDDVVIRLRDDPTDLRDKIKKVLNANPIGVSPEGHYLPEEEYKRLFKEDTIKTALGDVDTNKQLVGYILSDATKTFATLVQVFSDYQKRLKAIEAMKINGFKDEMLSSNTLELYEHQQPCVGSTHLFPFREPWDLTDFDEFKKKRWHFLVHKFEIMKFLYELDKDQLLPFRAVGGVVGNGHFSEVRRVSILVCNQDMFDVSDKTIFAALKSLKRIDDAKYDIATEWRREAKAHEQLNGKSKNIIKAFGAYRQIGTDPANDTYHLVLEWANGGSLLSYWENHKKAQLDHTNVAESGQRTMEMLRQLRGLAEALDAMHSTKAHSPDDIHDVDKVVTNSRSALTVKVENVNGEAATSAPDSRNWRHGDIKPANILRFIYDEDDTCLGVLKLADLGRAQENFLATRFRQTKEQELFRTRWYEPPDLQEQMRTKAKGGISRLFDIWSMGCVIFEAVLWLIYGYDSINRFFQANKLIAETQDATPYWRKTEQGVYEVSHAAREWMNHILDHDHEKNGAIGELVRLVRDRLLRVDVPQNPDVYIEGCRTNARDLKEQLSFIISKGEKRQEYLFSGGNRSNMFPPDYVDPGASTSPVSSRPSFLSPNDARRRDPIVPIDPSITIAQQREYTNSLDGKWKTIRDDEFFKSYMAGRDFPSNAPDLCSNCKRINILSSMKFEMGKLKKASNDQDCDLCQLVFKVMMNLELTGRSNITLTRHGYDFVLDGTGTETSQKVLRLCHTNTVLGQGRDAAIPLGVPSLVPVGSSDPSAASLDSFIRLPKAWLRECDEKHHDTCAPRPEKALPKRLINIKHPEKPRIIETADPVLDPQKTNYVALSHKWGNMPTDVVTTKQNIEERKKKILLSNLPCSFKNAISVTRALGCNYLWIDSLCILQGSDGDFDEEADKMRTTFSGAYCVLAASSAQSSRDGFLCRPDIQYVKKGDVFISELTNDFERDVLESPLNRRGWVLQERALARRTIFFTKTQMYWECGDGIRCETLTKLQNDKVAFLGDANFPDYTIRPTSTIGQQIDLFIGLFQQYTKLEFSHSEDRPIAIDGLMERLTVAFKTKSLAGLFQTFWGRCLLWRRAEGAEPLKRIPRGTRSRKTPPSWSWMAFDGMVSFIEPAGGQVEWNDRDVILPFYYRAQASWLRTSRQSYSVAISAEALEFHTTVSGNESQASLYYDGSDKPTNASTKCVIIGSEKQQDEDEGMRKHYVLIVRALPDASAANSYERVGVGYLLGRFIHFDRPSVHVTID